MATDDMALLRQYAVHQSEGAFAALVTRHTNLVYSTLLRLVRDPQLAEEVTQVVFIILVQKAGTLTEKTILPGWLYRTTCYVSKSALKREYRRHQREQEAYMQSTIDKSATDADWKQMSPLLEEAMLRLGQTDRDALVLRFFEGHSLNEVGLALGASEDAAKKRVNRALEKMHRYFSKRGIRSTTAIIAGAISANSVHAAPVTLGTSIAVTATGGSAVPVSTLSLAKATIKLMTWLKVKLAMSVAAAVVLAGGVATIAVSAHNSGANKSVHVTMPQSFDELLAGIKEGEMQLINLRVDGKCQYSKWDAAKRDWEYDGEADATAWYECWPGSKERVDIHNMILRWEDGAAPFAQTQESSTYDGKVGQWLEIEDGPVGDPVKTLEGQITTNRPFFLTGDTLYSGWPCSLYGCTKQHRKSLSEYLEIRKKDPRSQCTFSVIRHDDRDCVRLVVQTKFQDNFVLTETWCFDPAREYAILYREDSLFPMRMTVEKLANPAPGVFYPVKAIRETRTRTGGPKEKTTYEASLIVANDPKFTDDIFTIQWPSGTRVDDTIGGTNFTVTANPVHN